MRQQKLKAGECHVAPYPNPADLADLKADPNLQMMEQEGLNVGYLAYNALVAPFDKAEVRKALNMAINKQAILDAVFQGAGKIAKNPIPPTMWSYNNAIEDDAYDPDAAKKMLEAAGVKDLKMKIWAMPVQRPVQSECTAHGRTAFRQTSPRSAWASRSFPMSGASISSCRRKKTATVQFFWAGPVTMVIRTTSWRCFWVVMPWVVQTVRSGATRSLTA